MVDWEKKKLPEKNKLIYLKSSKKIKNITKTSSISLNPDDNSQLKITRKKQNNKSQIIKKNKNHNQIIFYFIKF